MILLEEIKTKEDSRGVSEEFEKISYQYRKQPPSLKEIQESQASRCVEITHQQYDYND